MNVFGFELSQAVAGTLFTLLFALSLGFTWGLMRFMLIGSFERNYD